MVPGLRELRFPSKIPFPEEPPAQAGVVQAAGLPELPGGVARNSQRGLCARSQGESTSAVSFPLKNEQVGGRKGLEGQPGWYVEGGASLGLSQTRS